MTRSRAPLNGVATVPAQGGFTLIEAMVALIVLSVGLLGIAAMYVETLRANRTSLYRTQAVTVASDIADRMRANRAPPDSYNCNGTCDPTLPPGIDPVADADIVDWLDPDSGIIATQLPGSTLAINYTAPGANTPAVYVVTISWTEVGQDDPAAFQLRVEI